MKVVVCGAGVIGASIAYFLAQKGIPATVVERNEVACAASGKSGGFIAQNWCDGQPQEQLARRSFALHAELAALFASEFGVDYGYSVILRPATPLPAQALFVEYECLDGSQPAPEIVPRPDGDVWLCGMPGTDALPEDPANVSVDRDACAELQRIAARLCRPLSNARLIAAQACYRPICADAMPIIGPVQSAQGAFIASAHNCWGMLNAPATGLAVSELLAEGAATSVDISPFSASRKELTGNRGSHV